MPVLIQKPTRKVKSNKKGFTLIELLVTTTIIIILSGVGVASYNNFNEKKVVESGAKKLEADLRLAQSKATSNEKPSSCPSSLTGWGVKKGTTDSEYQVYYNCGSGDIADKTISLTNLTLSEFNVFFQSLGGTDLSSEITIAVQGFGRIKNIIINPGGDIRIES